MSDLVKWEIYGGDRMSELLDERHLLRDDHIQLMTLKHLRGLMLGCDRNKEGDPIAFKHGRTWKIRHKRDAPGVYRVWLELPEDLGAATIE